MIYFFFELIKTNMAEKQRCEQLVAEAVHSPFVVFMMDALQKAGCPFDPVKHFQCSPCEAQIMGNFDPKVGVTLCQNRISRKQQVVDTMTHELIHAFDHCRAQVDWNNCYHHACSEIRAANLSGDCFFTKEIRRGNVGFGKQQQVCVKRRATISVQANPMCRDNAAEAVEAVFQTCFKDTAPFERIP